MTPEQVKKRFENEGKTFAGWAKENGFEYRTVIAVINGVNKGRHGKAHEVAVALGLKQVA
ncbi:DNA-binding protein [Pandoraea apista]|uniref:Phage-related DNA-binding protein n=1 Tax=Pandoraea apista TaxID=93218 RepID=A0A5E5P8T0_9BURK|nr:DNA-binding protein [Pandoraea apista]AJF00066.1 phage-related DNA-binding protein [Pandoraea apista]AKH74221.1 phage-related DNA-binding protein [Pandoraea apista]AKI62770.1 phage-related DNA-binding protein [Pandoraea apista]VVG72119.1 phage-related DNA-binding protein [Pandoraea apista]